MGAQEAKSWRCPLLIRTRVRVKSLYQEDETGRGKVGCSFLLSITWNVDAMARAPAATLYHEEALGIEATYGRGVR